MKSEEEHSFHGANFIPWTIQCSVVIISNMFPNLINQEINIFKQMAIQNLPICSFNEVRGNEVRGGADVSWSNLCPWIAQLLRVNIAPSPTSLCLI